MQITTIEQLDKVKLECQRLVTKRSFASAAVAILPVPGLDIVTDAGLLVELIPTINRRFGLSAEQLDALDHNVKQQIVMAATTAGNQFIGKVVTKKALTLLLKKVGLRVSTKTVAKYVPFVGSAIASSASFGAMKWLGNSHIEDCYAAVRAVLDVKPSGEGNLIERDGLGKPVQALA